LRGKIICPTCGEIGVLENQSGDKYRINHDRMKKGVRKSSRCYLGSLTKSLINLKNASDTRPDILESELIKELESKVNPRQNILKEIENAPYATLIARLIQLSTKLKSGWSNERHHLVKQAKCPYCTRRISIRFRRIGKNPDYSEGKYNIENLDIEKGNKAHTSYFGNRNPGHKGWFDSMYKSSSKIISDTFTESIETTTSQEKIREKLILKIKNHLIHYRS